MKIKLCIVLFVFGLLHGLAQAQPSGLTFTCKFNSGPKSGQTQSYAGVPGINPIPVGTPCTDGQGSMGVGVAARGNANPGGGTDPNPGMTLTCQFNSGPRSGQTQSYAGMGIQAIPIGSPCTDGQGSMGVGVK